MNITRIIMTSFLMISLYAAEQEKIDLEEGWEGIPRKMGARNQLEYVVEQNDPLDTCTIERLNSRNMAIVVTQVQEKQRQVYVDISSGLSHEAYKEQRSRASEFKSRNQKKVLCVVCVMCVNSLKPSQSGIEYQTWAQSLTQFFLPTRSQVIEYSDRTVPGAVDDSSEDCVLELSALGLKIKCIKERTDEGSVMQEHHVSFWGSKK